MRASLAPALACLFATIPASAEDASIRVDVAESCAPSVAGDALREAVALELRDAEAAVLSYVTLRRPRVEVACEGGFASARMIDGDLSDDERVSMARSDLVRFLAIAIVQGISAWASIPERTEPEPDPPAEAAAPASTPVSVWLHARGGLELGNTPLTIAGGGLVAVSVEVAALYVEAAAITTYGAVALEPGQVRELRAGGQLGLGLGGSVGPVWLAAGLGARALALLWEGLPQVPGTSGRASWLALIGAFGFARASAQVIDAVRVVLDIEAGAYLLGATGTWSGTEVLTTAPGWMAARLGVAVRLAP